MRVSQNPEPENWLMTRGNYAGWSYSPLAQINTSNVKNLVPVWSVSTGVNSGHEAPPIVNNGVMFVATPYSQVLALDAATGDMLWRYKRKLPEGFAALHNTSRGVGLYGDKVFFPAAGRNAGGLRRQDRQGRLGGEGRGLEAGLLHDHGAPGREGQGAGRRGGRRVRRARFRRSVRRGNRQVSMEDLHHPRARRARQRDLAEARHLEDRRRFHLDDGQLRSGHQHGLLGHRQRVALVRRSAAGRQPLHVFDGRAGRRHRQDQGALPVPSEQVLGLGRYECADAGRFPEGRRETKGLLSPQRNGYLYWLGRNADGSISYLDSEAYVPQNVFKSIDPKTGRPDVDLAHKPGTGKAAQFCPGLWGGKDWPYEAYNPKTGNGLYPDQRKSLQQPRRQGRGAHPGQWWTGVAIPDFHFTVDTKPGFFGALQAYDVNTGKRIWRDLYSNSMNWGSVLTTGGGLLFTGGTNDRMFRAYDAKSGEELWHFRTNSGIIAPPSTFEVNGVQYVGVASGYGVDPAFQQTLMADLGRLEPGRAAGRGRLGVRGSEVNAAAPKRSYASLGQPPELAAGRYVCQSHQSSGLPPCSVLEQRS